MKTGTFRLALIAAAATTLVCVIATAQEPPAAQRSGIFIDAVGLPDSLERLCDVSSLIVEGQVQSVFPASYPDPRNHTLETDAVVQVITVLKGNNPSKQIVLAQTGGRTRELVQEPVAYSLMEPGERYFLFLYGPPAKDSLHQDRPGLQRYWITGIWAGLLRLQQGFVSTSHGVPDSLRQALDNKRESEIRTKMNSYTGCR